jgi:hypothetical protein
MVLHKADQRAVRARVLTSSGWVRGTFHVPLMHGLVDFLDHAGPYLKLTDAILPGTGTAVQFFALRRAALVAAVPEVPETELYLPAIAMETVRHRISCLLPAGAIEGELEVVAGTRVSDYLMHQLGFIVLRRAVGPEAGIAATTPASLLLVNAVAIVGVSESLPM